MRYRAVISYLGSDYAGWQRQKNAVTVQEVLEKALSSALGVETTATASGRTDAGVHAEGQAIHFDADTSIPCDKIPFAVNAKLPPDISMLSCEPVSDDFNARFSAKRKTYCYKLYLSRQPRPMLEPTHAHIVVPLDIAAMREAARLIEGTHDFKCFEASGARRRSTVRTVYSLSVEAVPFAETKNADEKTDRAFDCEMLVTVEGNGFLYNMVRIIAGTLVYVGLHKLTLADVEKIISSGDRTLAGKTLPAQGLCLLKVDY